MIALYGGSFDPIHEGHIYLAQSLLKHFPFEKIYFVPAKQNPLKDEEPRATGEMRLQMLKAALRECNEPRFETLDWEIKRQGPSYTIDTVEKILTEHQDVAFVIGNEIFNELPGWHEPKKLLQIAHCVVVTRDATIPFSPLEILRKTHIADARFLDENRVIHSQNSRWISQMKINALPFSATQIRRKIKEQWNKNELEVPPPGIQRSVWLLIKENHLYTVTKEVSENK